MGAGISIIETKLIPRVPAEDLGEWKQLCDMYGVDGDTMATFGEKVYRGTVNGETLQGHDRPWTRDNPGGVDGHAGVQRLSSYIRECGQKRWRN